MRGGQHRYKGSGRGARAYIEADHHRADDYYLAEGAGIAEVVRVDRNGAERDRLSLSGDDYEAWVEGVDVFDPARPAKGTLRHDAKALRFVEVVVNGPKSWSLAAGLHPDVSQALDAAQERAVTAIGGYVAGHATTRVGGRGKQQQVPVDGIEMAQIRHYTTRAGDPHRHVHVQVNGRVLARGRWRGLDSRAMSQMQRAINGIGHRSVMADPEFREALAAHGYTLRVDGEIVQLADAVPAMSKRAAQVARNVARYEAQWRRANPGVEPDRELLRTWDARAWADQREAKKLHPTRAAECEETWVSELRALGVDVDALRVAGPRGTGGVPVGAVDREEAAERVLRVLGSGHNGRSRWNVWDVRGVAEEVLAGRFVVAAAPVFAELVEDVAARAAARSVSLLEAAAPDHVRQLTSEYVIAQEQDITGRLAARAIDPGTPVVIEDVARVVVAQELRASLDAGQVQAVQAIAGTAPLVVVEGAAGSGKTDMLGVAQAVIEAQGGRLRVVAPTKRAAQEAAGRLGRGEVEPGTAHLLVHDHGFRWDADGVWSRLAVGEHDPKTGRVYEGPMDASVLTSRDVLVCDEAGMLDQETAAALLQIADAAGARLVSIGDRRQLPSVGRGGFLDMAVAQSAVHVQLSGVHRFRTADGGRDAEYAALTLRMREGLEPERVFDDLVAGGHVELWDSEAEQLAYLASSTAQRYTDGQSEAVSVATNAEADAINEVVRERLVLAGVVDDSRVEHGMDGLRVGVGDRVMSRLNDAQNSVANRDTWTVREVPGDGSLRVAGDRGKPDVVLAPEYVRQSIQLAYACTVHGVQGCDRMYGGTALSDAMDAPSLYVAMTRGRRDNTVHIVAGDMDEARDKWVDTAGRNRADLGLEQARAAAAAEAQNYAVVARQQVADWAEKVARTEEQVAARAAEPRTVPTAPQRQQQSRYRESPSESIRQRGPRL